jgi:hypothetical protein
MEAWLDQREDAQGTGRSVSKTLGLAKKLNGSWHQWLTPVILATQEAEIRRIMAQSQPWANSSRDPISKCSFTKKKAGGEAQVVAHLPSKCNTLS